MAVCGNRTETPGFFKGCGPCRCGQLAAQAGDQDAERLAVLIGEGVGQVEASHQLWPRPVVDRRS